MEYNDGLANAINNNQKIRIADIRKSMEKDDVDLFHKFLSKTFSFEGGVMQTPDNSILKKTFKICCSNGYIKYIKILVDEYLFDDYKNIGSYFCTAIINGQNEIVEYLLKLGTITHTYIQHESAYPLAIRHGKIDILKILIDNKIVDEDNSLEGKFANKVSNIEFYKRYYKLQMIS